jgi:hypothetical protein
VKDAVGGAFAFGGGQEVMRPPERVKLTLGAILLLSPSSPRVLVSKLLLVLHARSGIPTQHYHQLKKKQRIKKIKKYIN